MSLQQNKGKLVESQHLRKKIKTTLLTLVKILVVYFLAKVVLTVLTGAIAVGGYHIRGDIFTIRLCTTYPDTGVIVFLMLYIVFTVYNPLIYQQMNGHHFYTILIRGSMLDLPLTQSDYLSWLFLQLTVAWCPRLFDFNSKLNKKKTSFFNWK